MSPADFEAEVLEVQKVLADSLADVDGLGRVMRLTALHIAASAILHGAEAVHGHGHDRMLGMMIADAWHRFENSPPEYLETLVEATRRTLLELGAHVIGPVSIDVEPTSKTVH